MLSVTEAAAMLGISSARVRKLIADGEIEAVKIGNAWVLEERAVLNRIAKHPRPGRPQRRESGALRDVQRASFEAAKREKNANEVFRTCKELFSTIPDASMLVNAESSEEAAFYIAISDFFLQQRQHELIDQGIF